MSSIKGTNVLAPVVPFDTTDAHASHEARYGKGGYRSVADIAERDAIPQLRREAGMLVCVLTDGKVWKLGDNLTTWTEFNVSSDWATLSGKPSTFPPSSHTHTASAITDFASAVAAAAPPTTDASLLVSGTLSASRLPASVVLTTDGRLSDARTPTAHSHAIADVSGLQTALSAKATPADVTSAVAAVVNASPASLDTLAELAAALNNDASFSATVTNALAAKAPIASPTFTGTVSGITKSMVGLGSVDDTADASKPVSAAQAAADSAVASTAASDATSKANAAQAYAVQRANHTGTQTAATVSDFATAAISATSGSYAAASHTHALSSLTQSSATTGQVATWNGSAWTPAAPFSSLATYATVASFPATGSSSVLYVASDSSRAYQWTGSVYVEIGTAGGGGSGGATTDASLLTSGTLLQARLDHTPIHPFILMGG